MATEKRQIYLEDAIARIVDTPSYVATMAFEGYYGFIRNPANILVDIQHEILDLLEAVPTVDAVEVVHGRWNEKQELIPWCEDDVDTYWMCSVCGAIEIGKTNYCHNCGAKMDGDGNG